MALPFQPERAEIGAEMVGAGAWRRRPPIALRQLAHQPPAPRSRTRRIRAAAPGRRCAAARPAPPAGARGPRRSARAAADGAGRHHAGLVMPSWASASRCRGQDDPATSSGRSSCARWPRPGSVDNAACRQQRRGRARRRPAGWRGRLPADHQDQRRRAAAAGRGRAAAGPNAPSCRTPRRHGPGCRASRRYSSVPTRIEPSSRYPRSAARSPCGPPAHATRTTGAPASWTAASLAIGENTWPGRPRKGSRAPFRLTSCRGAMRPSRHIRARMAAPAECPTATHGPHVERVEQPAQRRAPCRAATALAARGISVKPWPGRSGATTVNCSASSGARSRQEWVAAPVPWTSSSIGPLPHCWTCQFRPPAVTKRLASRFGQSAPSCSQAGCRAAGPLLTAVGRRTEPRSCRSGASDRGRRHGAYRP